MTEYRQLNLFDEYVDDELDENLVEEVDEFSLYQHDTKQSGVFEYQVFDPYGVSVAKWTSRVDCLSMSTSEYQRSGTKNTFMKVIKQEKDKEKKALELKRSKEQAAKKDIAKNKDSKSTYRYQDDDDGVSWYRGGSSYSYSSPYSGGYSSFVKPKSTGFLDKLNKSNTLVIHCQDNSTDMLSQIYDGKGWDVLRDGNIDKEELHQLLQSHERIVCLGHGTSGGLINVQGGGTVIGAEEAPFLKDKKLFIIWCNADGYFNRYGIGDGQFITGNMPSEVWECRAAGCGEISSQLMLENITYWSKLCADVTEKALNGDAEGAVKYVRDNYIKKYGDHPVTIYNAERTKVHGKPMEDLSDRYWGPEELLHPKTPTYTYKPTSTAAYDPHKVPAVSNPSNAKPKSTVADDKLGKYDLNPDTPNERTGADLYNYIDWVEGLLSQELDYEEIDYWTEVEDGEEVLIMVVTTDGEEYYYMQEADDIIPLQY